MPEQQQVVEMNHSTVHDERGFMTTALLGLLNPFKHRGILVAGVAMGAIIAGAADGAGRDNLVIGSVEESTTVAHAELRRLTVKQEFCVAEGEVAATVGKRIIGKPFGINTDTGISGLTLNLDRSVVYNPDATLKRIVKFCFDAKEVEYTYDPSVMLMRDRQTDAEKADPERRASITIPDATATNSAVHIYVVGSRDTSSQAYQWTSNGLPTWWMDSYKNVFQQELVQKALTANGAANLNIGQQIDNILTTSVDAGADEIAAQACTGDSANKTMLSTPVEKVLDDGLAEKVSADVANIDKVVLDKDDVTVNIGKQNPMLADEMQTRLNNEAGALSSLNGQNITIGPIKVGPVDLGSMQLAISVEDTDNTMKNATCTIAPSASNLTADDKGEK